MESAISELLDLELRAATMNQRSDITEILESDKKQLRIERGGLKLDDHIDTVKKILEML